MERKTLKEECLISLRTQDKRDLWHVDSGRSKHMTGDKEKILNLNKQKSGVTFGDNASCNIIGKGIVNVGKYKDKNVFLVENMKPSLLSLSQTCD